jgi:hypothetical protein
VVDLSTALSMPDAARALPRPVPPVTITLPSAYAESRLAVACARRSEAESSSYDDAAARSVKYAGRESRRMTQSKERKVIRRIGVSLHSVYIDLNHGFVRTASWPCHGAVTSTNAVGVHRPNGAGF